MFLTLKSNTLLACFLFYLFCIDVDNLSNHSNRQNVHIAGTTNVIIAKCQVKNTLGSFVNILYDSNSSYKWLEKCKFAKVIKKVSDTSGYFIFVYTSPSILVRSQCLILLASLNRSQKNQSVILKLKKQMDLPKDIREIGNIYKTNYKAVDAEDFDITWEFSKAADSVNVKLTSYIQPSLNSVAIFFNFLLPKIAQNYAKEVATQTAINICEESKKKKYLYSKSALISE